MELKVIDVNDSYSHVALIGKMDVIGSGEIENKFLGYTASRKLNAIVDLSGVTFLGSMGLRVFLSSAKALNLEGKHLILLKPVPLVQEVVEASGLGTILIIEHDLDAAIATAKS